ncbi:MAG TPA: cytochrome c biogenesis protein [Polyangium sp.]|nr:cytochrome c biogenesis protein [Polyangium sp.]
MATKDLAAPQTSAPGPSTKPSELVFYALVGLAIVGFVAAVHVIFFRAPVEATMGFVQKIFYFHVPAAVSMYIGATTCFVGSAGYLARGTRNWDALARAGAEVAVLMGMMVLLSGPLWGAKAWGVYWTWDPRLTTSLLSILIYVAYVVLRSFAGDGDAERKFAAALGVLGAANLPIIHYSVQKWGGNHPKVISSGGGGLKHPDMKLALNLGFVAFFLLTALLIWSRYRVEVSKNRLQQLEEEALELGLGEE